MNTPLLMTAAAIHNSTSNDRNIGEDEDNSSVKSNGSSSSADGNKKPQALPSVVRFETIEVGSNNKTEREDGGFPLPINDQSNFTWTPINTGDHLQVMTDYTLACQKASCSKIWSTSRADNNDDPSKQVFHWICFFLSCMECLA
jgi:hypothetical protein